MSKAKQGGGGGSSTTKEVSSVVLPQFPRSDDAKGPIHRSKWIQDYDRVQSELLRTHLSDASGNGSTCTLSLRQLPADWEEQMRQQLAQKAQLEAARQRAEEKKRKERRHQRSLSLAGLGGESPRDGRMSTSPSRNTAASGSPSFYKSGPKNNGDDTFSSSYAANSNRNNLSTIPKARSSTADLYSENQATFSKTLPSPVRPKSRGGGASFTYSPRPTTALVGAAPTTSYSRLTLSPTRHDAALSNESVVTTFAATRLPSTAECSRIINHLLLPPANFKKSVQPNLKHIDLTWIKRRKPGEPVACDLNLDSMREDICTAGASSSSLSGVGGGGGGVPIAINSPRSVIVLLRNGCTVEDLQMRPMDYFRTGKNKAHTAHNSSSLALGPGSQSLEMNEEMAAMAQRHYESRRVALLGALRSEYRDLCREVSVLDLVENANHLQRGVRKKEGGGGGTDDEDDAATASVTFLKERKERLVYRRALELEQLAKHQALAEALRRKAAESEEKRFLADLEHKRQLEQRKEEAFERQRAAEKRQELLRQQTGKLNEEYQEKLAERRYRLEQKEQQMQANRVAHRQEVQMEAQRKAARRQERMEKQKELQEELLHTTVQKQAEQDEAERQRREKKEKQIQQQKEQMAEAQRLAEERRIASKRAAEEHEEELRNRALEKAQLAEQKLKEFQQRQRQRRAEEAAEEAKKNAMRQKAFESAVEHQETRKEAFLTKRLTHEQHMAELEAAQKRATAKQHELEREAEDDKRMYVQRRTLAIQFDQLMSIANIERKREKGEAVANQREKIVDLTLKEREKIRLQRERYEEELRQKAVTNQLQ